MQSGESEFQIQAYDFEQEKENKKRLLEIKKETYFSVYKVARIIVHHEIQRTRSYK